VVKDRGVRQGFRFKVFIQGHIPLSVHTVAPDCATLQVGTHVHLLIGDCETDPVCNGCSFIKLCRLPAQHLAGYVPRLQAVLAATPERHPDFNALSDAVEKVRSAVLQTTAHCSRFDRFKRGWVRART
jgi:hypothetical protein